MSSSKLVCPRCNGKGKAKLKDVDTYVNCPTCNGKGYLNNDFLQEDEVSKDAEQIKVETPIYKEINQNTQILILQQIIKNPDLFLAGIKLLFKDENNELFIYLQNQHIFEIENQTDGMLIKLKSEYKNNLAKQCIEYLTAKKTRKKKNE